MDYDYMEAATPNSTAVAELAVKQKRRIYDITNVLEASKESVLDQQKMWVQQSIKNTTRRLRQLLISLSYVLSNGGGQRGASIQIHLKSVNGPIDVLLINKDPAASTPVSLPVPPPRDLFSRSPPCSSSSRIL
ncbi:hypothetical protein CRUP_010391 [Coryphaenoides rupestris]|nr:hypothetical protein CRUP_010391 [Coryphaenoides rupestris]